VGIKSFKKDSFDALYDTYAGKVYYIALYYSGNHHAAEDVTQTVFMTLYMNRENVNMDRVEAWLKTTAKHRALNMRRDSDHEMSAGITRAIYMFDNSMYVENVEELFIGRYNKQMRKELAEEIYLELYRENERWYNAITIVYILQKPQKEVAETMGISLGALQLMLHRAKKWIRKQYQEKLDHLKE